MTFSVKFFRISEENWKCMATLLLHFCRSKVYLISSLQILETQQFCGPTVSKIDNQNNSSDSKDLHKEPAMKSVLNLLGNNSVRSFFNQSARFYCK